MISTQQKQTKQEREKEKKLHVTHTHNHTRTTNLPNYNYVNDPCTNPLPGDPLPYARWIVGQPDNAGGTEDCAEITYQALWNDLPCTLSRYYACEIPVAQCDQLKDDIRCSYLL